MKGSDYISVQQRWCPIPLHDSKADVLMGPTQPQEGGAQPQSIESPVWNSTTQNQGRNHLTPDTIIL